MPIKSYLAFSRPGHFEEMVNSLQEQSWAEVHPSHNQSVAVLVTESHDLDEEKQLESTLGEIESIQCLALVFGHSLEEPLVC